MKEVRYTATGSETGAIDAPRVGIDGRNREEKPWRSSPRTDRRRDQGAKDMPAVPSIITDVTDLMNIENLMKNTNAPDVEHQALVF
jgi:hypothetical protein